MKLEREASSLKPEGYNEGTLLTYRLNEIENGEHGEKARRQRFTKDNLPIKRAVFIDSTWNQCRGIYKDPRINSLQSVVLQHRLSQFWRHQKNSPRWYLATVEGNLSPHIANILVNKMTPTIPCFQPFINSFWRFM